MKDTIKKEKHYDHPIGKVWEAISQAEEISAWFIHAGFKAEVGYEYTFTATEEHGCTKVHGRVLEASPYVLKYTWRVEDAQLDTYVTWTLESEGDGTKLVLEHSGMSQFPEASAIEMMGHFEKGWDACMLNLAPFLEGKINEPAH